MKLKISIILFILLITLAGCSKKIPKEYTENNISPGAYGDDLPISRGEACRMLSLCIYSYKDILSFEKQADFSDISKEDLLYKYVNALYKDGIMLGNNKKFRPSDYLTVQEAAYIIDAADSSDRISLDTGESSYDNPISYYMWMQILEKLMEAGDITGGEETTMTVLMTDKKDSSIEGYALTDKNLFKTDGYVPENLENVSVKFLIKDDSIIGIKSVESLTPVLEKALVIKTSGNSWDIFFKGCKKTFITEIETDFSKPFIADITVNGNKIIESKPYNSEKKGEIIAVSDTILFDDGYSYNISDSFYTYFTYDNNIRMGGINDLISGCTFRVIFNNNTAVCAVCEEKLRDENIRMCLSADNGGLVHRKISISSDSGFKLKGGDKTESYNNSDIINISEDTENSLFKGKLITVLPENGGKLIINNKVYSCSADIIKNNTGEYTIICDMDLESYLYGVLSAEMPSSWDIEALKAQAVASRTYACRQKLSGRCLAFGGNVDDTTAFQVYSADNFSDEAVKAVNETKGQVITYKNELINACFYSTSCGIGASSGDIWSDGKNYPSATPVYLKSKRIGKEDIPDFSSEEKAVSFFRIKDENDIEASAPYYRWSFTADLSSINADYISVLERGKGGNVMKLLIEKEDEDITLEGESKIRSFIKPGNVKLSDGSVVNLNVLPSSFFAIEPNEDGTFIIYGGGLGHGAGMSQYGAKVLSEQGKSYMDIIKLFYPETDISKI